MVRPAGRTCLRVVRSGKDVRTGCVVSFLSQRRELLDVAWPGDIIGIPNHGTLQLGDTLTEGEDLQFTGLPFFAPEIFQTIEIRIKPGFSECKI